MVLVRLPIIDELTSNPNESHSVSIPLPRSRVSGCSYRSPLAHFYIHHAVSSILELHPFTTITYLGSIDSPDLTTDDYLIVQFLFRKRGRKDAVIANPNPSKCSRLWSRVCRSNKEAKTGGEWTEKVAAFVDRRFSNSNIVRRGSAGTIISVLYPRVDIALRVEGPYFSPANPSRYDKVICFVAGTGISGAIAIAKAFIENSKTSGKSPTESSNSSPQDTPRSPWRKCVVVWSVRDTDFVELPFFEHHDGLEIRNYITGQGRQRVDIGHMLRNILTEDPLGKTWVYISGPNSYIEAGKSACKAEQGVDFYAASWEI